MVLVICYITYPFHENVFVLKCRKNDLHLSLFATQIYLHAIKLHLP